MGQEKDMCIYELGECVNDFNCSVCPVKERYDKDLKVKKLKKKFIPSEWEEVEIPK